MRQSKIIILQCCISFFIVGNAITQNLINYLPKEETFLNLSPNQRHYYQEIISWEGAIESHFVTLNLNMLKQKNVRIDFGHSSLTAFQLHRDEEESLSRRQCWSGYFPGMPGKAHFVYGNDQVVGHIQTEGFTLLIKPLGNGLHLLLEWDMGMEDGCTTSSIDQLLNDSNTEKKPQALFLENTDLSRKRLQSESRDLAATGECRVRVLVAYTDDVAASFADILSEIEMLFVLANEAYIEGDDAGDPLDLHIELAATYQVNYEEPVDNNTAEILTCLRSMTDGCLDDIHVQRDLWDADQCALIFTGNGGLARIGPTDDTDMFSVTGSNLFGLYTFHHELGHNAGCSHAVNQSQEPGTPPWAGFGHPSGCYRTIMAYPDACGQGDCPRQNIFSDDDPLSWLCSGAASTPGNINARNQDRLHLSAPIMVAHRTVPENANYENDYNWGSGEAVNFAASNTLTYASASNRFEFFSGSAGSFRASESVTLGRGFWARSGTSFRAYIHNCTPLTSLPEQAEQKNQADSLVVRQHPVLKAIDEEEVFTISPNPFSRSLKVDYSIVNTTLISLRLLDPFGKACQIILAGEAKEAGDHSLDIETAGLPTGVYILELIAGEERQVQKVVKVGD
jgi:hypothetical protein